MEAALVSLGSVSETIVDDYDEDEPSAAHTEVRSLLTNIIPSILSLSGKLAQLLRAQMDIDRFTECPFLQGRSFVFASQYAQLLPTELAGQYLNAAIQVVEASEAGIPIKISAIKALSK